MKLLTIVGIGPGSAEQMTGEALETLQDADVIIGYKTYADLVREILPDKKFVESGMRREEERCEQALEMAQQDQKTAMVCSGDGGVYGMAGLCMELGRNFPDVEIRVVPGVTAALSGAALLGAPLMNDFAVISLSDLMTPWDQIEKRVKLAAEGDFSIVLYNPGSHTRTDGLRRACDIMLESREPENVCGIVRQIGRNGQETKLMTLKELRDCKPDMLMTVFIGTSQTKMINGKMVTPRGYRCEQ